MSGKPRIIIVTDLDGSLLDSSYSWSDALPALGRIKKLNVPLVLNSSKTMAEMRELANALDTAAPIVAENGGILAVHEGSGFSEQCSVSGRMSEYLIEVNGLARSYILEKAHALRSREGYLFEGFSDWTDMEVSAKTGLSESMASWARSRHATEPILWNDTPERRELFEAALKSHGIRILRGGQFLHLMGMADKADGLRSAVRICQQAQPDHQCLTVAVGDSANDLAMLEAADIAVVIPHADGPHIQPNAPKVVYASAPASKGWNEAILTILQEYK